ncbi:hypothetical protein [Pedobacter sp. GR22-6]|uniref:hypothetical protein n=1 Tax=Pedobacter sp. GR22-6 TaxID=3127957 RepID=UPI00307D34C5
MDIFTDIFTYNKSLAKENTINKNFQKFVEFTGSYIHLLPSIQSFDVAKLARPLIKKKLKRTPYLTIIAQNLFDPKIFSNRTNGFTKTFLSSDLKVNVYGTVEEFLEYSWPKIEFIDDQWIPDNLDHNFFKYTSWRYLIGINRIKALNWFKEITDQTVIDYQMISYYHLHDSHGDRLIYELSKNIYKVCLPREYELEIRVFTDQNFHINLQCFARLNLNIIICDKRIIDLEIASITLDPSQKENVGSLKI